MNELGHDHVQNQFGRLSDMEKYKVLELFVAIIRLTSII